MEMMTVSAPRAALCLPARPAASTAHTELAKAKSVASVCTYARACAAHARVHGAGTAERDTRWQRRARAHTYTRPTHMFSNGRGPIRPT
eukprot:3822118-Alexandrium_andersonii.AAC.1